MKNRIFMYLFIFSLLLLLFQFINSKSIFDDSNEKVANYKEQVGKYKDSIVVLNDKIDDLSLFSMEGNESAITYFLNEGLKVDNLLPIVRDQLYSLNEAQGEHPLVPYASSEGNRMLISSVRIINHKWILANFTDGQFNGELFVAYELNEVGELKFRLIESFLYPLE